MKSLRVDPREAIDPPTRLAADYTAEEKAAFREQFKPLAAHYRRWRRLTRILMAGIIFSMLFVQRFPKNSSEISYWIFFGGMILLGLATPRMPLCPACHHLLNTDPHRFCPDCGNRTLVPGDWFKLIFCRSCNKHLRSHKSRNFKVHACTHCGLILDEKGF